MLDAETTTHLVGFVDWLTAAIERRDRTIKALALHALLSAGFFFVSAPAPRLALAHAIVSGMAALYILHVTGSEQ